MGWLDHDRLGFNYRLSDIACALGIAQLERLEEMLAARARVAGRYREALAGHRGPGAARARTPTATGAAGSCSSCSCRAGVDRDETVRALAARGIQSKPYLPAIHLMSFYRERFGHREGEFPVCEDVAARSLALPFFPEMSEGQIARVAERAGAVLGRAAERRGRLRRAVSRFREPQHPDFQRLNASIALRPAAVAAGHRPVARPRARCSPRGRSSPTRTATRCSPALDAVEGELAERARSPSTPTTKTSTWRSSGA